MERPTSTLEGEPIYFEYTKACDINMPAIVPQALHGDERGVSTINYAKALQIPYRATSPNLLVSFINLEKGDTVRCAANASSHVFMLVSGAVTISNMQVALQLHRWDCMTLPASTDIQITAQDKSRLYWVNDEPLLNYLGVVPQRRLFKPTHYDYPTIKSRLSEYNAAPDAATRNRHGVLLANKACPITKTLSPTLWALFNITPPKTTQSPHRHNSVALDLCVYAPDESKGEVYTLMSEKLDEEGNHIDPVRLAWQSGQAFVTPPGWWHSHVNETDEDAIVYPVQDAGLHTYLRTLFIEFA